ncbi:MAG: hypothetical protein ACRDJH_24615, partial [Thermomicrobiales bacterium]
ARLGARSAALGGRRAWTVRPIIAPSRGRLIDKHGEKLWRAGDRRPAIARGYAAFGPVYITSIRIRSGVSNITWQ